MLRLRSVGLYAAADFPMLLEIQELILSSPSCCSWLCLSTCPLGRPPSANVPPVLFAYSTLTSPCSPCAANKKISLGQDVQHCSCEGPSHGAPYISPLRPADWLIQIPLIRGMRGCPHWLLPIGPKCFHSTGPTFSTLLHKFHLPPLLLLFPISP